MGFFNLEKAEKKAPISAGRKKIVPIRELAQQAPYSSGCGACTLDKEEENLAHPKMEPTGAIKPLIYILGEAPGDYDDRAGEQFTSSSAEELVRDYVPKALEKKIRWSNVVHCRPPADRAPSELEIACCSLRVDADIEKTKPKVIMGFGIAPLRWAIAETNIGDWRGDIVPIQVGKHQCWYACLWDPSFVSFKRRDKKVGESHSHTYARDLKQVFDALPDMEKPYIPDSEEIDAGINIIEKWDVGAVEAALALMRKKEPLAQSVDIETNGLRPYFKEAKILSIAFGTWRRSIGIPISHRENKWSDRQRKQVWGVVRDHMETGIEMWAHHLKFETEWLTMLWALGRRALFTVNWHDTMAQAHVLSSKGLSGLSLNSRSKALIGIAEKSIDALDRARLDSYPLPVVLKYNARDTKFTDLVRERQVKLIEKAGLGRAYSLIRERVPALTIAQQNGVPPDMKAAGIQHTALQKEIKSIEAKIQALPAVIELVKDKGVPFKTTSNPQLVTLLRDNLRLKEGWRMEGGVRKYSTDEKTLNAIKHPIGPLILEKRSLEKLDGTYVVGCCKPDAKDKDLGKMIWDDGLIHTNYNYLRTSTGRLSSDDPNLQNFPMRKHKEVRRIIAAPLGEIMVSVDYGQIEARVIAMASLCPILTEALWEHYDIHMAWTETIAKAHRKAFVKYLKEAKDDTKLAMKLFRSDIKNQWTFPLFFGSPLGAVAAAMQIDESALKPQFNAFWKMFAAVKQWQGRVEEGYRKNGYVQTLTGRRRYEPLSFNEMINSPIQGTASDIVVDSMRELANISYNDKRPHLAARMNIHDDLTFILPKESLEEDLGVIIETMVTPRFDFINVPITAEIKVGPNWADMEELATVESTQYGHPKRNSASKLRLARPGSSNKAR